jgi:hypothetical protein
MSDALNKLFKDKGVSFLADNAVSIEGIDGKDPIRGSLWNFDLNTERLGNRQTVVIRPRAAKNLSSSTDVVAYWLAWEEYKATEITLGGEANFFFTSELTGCRVIVSGSTVSPKIVHVAGNVSQPDRDKLAAPHLLDATSRQLSSTKSHTLGVPAYQPSAALDDASGTLWATVIGFRKGENWEFWYQIVSGNGYQLDKLFPV